MFRHTAALIIAASLLLSACGTAEEKHLIIPHQRANQLPRFKKSKVTLTQLKQENPELVCPSLQRKIQL